MKVENHETDWILRLEGDVGLTLAAKLKALLLEGLASGKRLEVDLRAAGEIDVTVLQLLFAASRAAERQNRQLVTKVSEAIATLGRDAGFGKFPGEAFQSGLKGRSRKARSS